MPKISHDLTEIDHLYESFHVEARLFSSINDAKVTLLRSWSIKNNSHDLLRLLDINIYCIRLSHHF